MFRAVQSFTPWLAGAAALAHHRVRTADRTDAAKQFPRCAAIYAGQSVADQRGAESVTRLFPILLIYRA